MARDLENAVAKCTTSVTASGIIAETMDVVSILLKQLRKTSTRSIRRT